MFHKSNLCKILEVYFLKKIFPLLHSLKQYFRITWVSVTYNRPTVLESWWSKTKCCFQHHHQKFCFMLINLRDLIHLQLLLQSKIFPPTNAFLICMNFNFLLTTNQLLNVSIPHKVTWKMHKRKLWTLGEVKLKKTYRGLERRYSGLKVFVVFQKTWVQVPANGSQLPTIPVPGDLTPCSGLIEHLHVHGMHTHTQYLKIDVHKHKLWQIVQSDSWDQPQENKKWWCKEQESIKFL